MDQLFDDKSQAIGDVPSEEPKFGDQLKQLETIVAQLESGQMDLEDSMKTYGQGVHLIHALQEKLSSAEQKLSVMMDEITPST